MQLPVRTVEWPQWAAAPEGRSSQWQVPQWAVAGLVWRYWGMQGRTGDGRSSAEAVASLCLNGWEDFSMRVGRAGLGGLSSREPGASAASSGWACACWALLGQLRQGRRRCWLLAGQLAGWMGAVSDLVGGVWLPRACQAGVGGSAAQASAAMPLLPVGSHGGSTHLTGNRQYVRFQAALARGAAVGWAACS